MSYVRVTSVSFSVTLIKGGQWVFEGLGYDDLRIRGQSCSSAVVNIGMIGKKAANRM